MEKEMVLELLDEIDKFRRQHQDQKKDPSDYCMRVIEAIIAKKAGFESRTEWTDELKAIPSFYRTDLENDPVSFC